jgi:hypothetical protein
MSTNSRWNVRGALSAVALSVLLGTGAAGASAAQQSTAGSQTVATQAASASAAAASYTRICDRGYGKEPWDVQDAVDCAGTVTYYKDGVSQGSMNMAVYVASQPPRSTFSDLYEGAQAWCSANSLTCTIAVAIAAIPLTALFGHVTS